MSRSIACIDYRDGKIFIAKRQMVGDMGGRWEFPGGKIEDGEDLQTAVVREMQEEFGVTVTVGRKITSGTFTHKGKPCTLDVLESIWELFNEFCKDFVCNLLNFFFDFSINEDLSPLFIPADFIENLEVNNSIF